MEFEKPSTKGFTVYSKSGCPNCSLVKKLLKDKNLIFNVIDCDEYIIEDKANFLLFIKNLTQRDIKQFPIIFYEGTIVGGYNEVNLFVDKLFLSFDDNFGFCTF
jgi:glutaredoxin